jgi:hypothetical protein
MKGLPGQYDQMLTGCGFAGAEPAQYQYLNSGQSVA